MNITPVTLTGKYVRLAPMGEAAIPALQEAARDPAIWNWSGPGTDPERVAAYVHLALEESAKRHRSALRDNRPCQRCGGRFNPLYGHRHEAQKGRNRQHLADPSLSANAGEYRGQVFDAHPRFRDARLHPG